MRKLIAQLMKETNPYLDYKIKKMELNVSLPDAKKLGLIRTYPVEILIFCLLVAVLFLAGWQYRSDKKIDALQIEMKSYLHEDKTALIQSLDRSTETNIKVVEGLEKVTDALRENNKNFK